MFAVRTFHKITYGLGLYIDWRCYIQYWYQ